MHSQNPNCNRTVGATSGKSTPPTETNILTWPVLIFASGGDYSVGVRIALRWYSLLLLTGTWGCEEVQLITMTELGLKLQTVKLKNASVSRLLRPPGVCRITENGRQRNILSSPLMFPHPCLSLFILEVCLMEKPSISHALEKKDLTLLITLCRNWCIFTWLQTRRGGSTAWRTGLLYCGLIEPPQGSLISNWVSADRCVLRPSETCAALLGNKTVGFMERTSNPPRIPPRLQTNVPYLWNPFLCNDKNLSFFLLRDSSNLRRCVASFVLMLMYDKGGRLFSSSPL